MTKHKWHKEIKAWAEGAEIEVLLSIKDSKDVWLGTEEPLWHHHNKYRIKPQPVECITKDCTNHKNQGTFVKEKNNGTDVG